MKKNNNSIKQLHCFICIVLLFSGLFSCTNSNSSKTEKSKFEKALPIWAEGRETEMNLNLGFRAVFQAEKNQEYKLKITGSTLYRAFLNGEFLGYGPARSAHGYFRVDEYDLSKQLTNGENVIAIEVAGYNVNTYYTIDQPSFLQAELSTGKQIILATGTKPDFEAFEIKERLQKVERYSFQRPFTEYYRLKNDFDKWKTSAKVPVELVKTAIQPSVQLLPRNLLLPEFAKVQPQSVCLRGTIKFQKPEKYKKDRSLVRISEKFKGYNEDEPEVLPSQFIQEIVNQTQDTTSKQFNREPFYLAKNEFITLDFGTNLSGFIGSKISCSEPSKVVFYFDEMLTDNDVNTKKRMQDINNQVVYELEPGSYNIETFESYTFKFLKVIVLGGTCQFEDVYLREYAYPENHLATFSCNNLKLNEIYKAARQTFRQNSVDIFMDCPSRERAGWLCDSYFTAIMEKDFTGKSDIAHNFYENYALPENFEFLPDGMLPMCYPADHNDGVFIPNWALWFIIQIDDYAERGGDPKLVSQLKPRIEKLLEYFAKFENQDGLLEKLDSWIFVEWSKANSFVQDVNYPTNMLYSEALKKAANLYNNNVWEEKAKHIHQTILEQSFNGTFFVDNAIREADGTLKVTNNTTEVCQYYAFFFNIATPDSHPELWKKLTTEFGPNRDDSVIYPDVFRANAFIGNYLRMDILSKYGLQNQLLKEIQDYFYYMAERTGTLWEHDKNQASCNHGFASYIGHILYRDVLGIKQIDYQQKEVIIRFPDIDLNKCSGAIPVVNGIIKLEWEKTGNEIKYKLETPNDFRVNIENNSSCKLVKIQ